MQKGCADDGPQVTFTKGDEKSFKELYGQFYKQLVYFVDKMLQDPPLSEEIVVDSFVALPHSIA